MSYLKNIVSQIMCNISVESVSGAVPDRCLNDSEIRVIQYLIVDRAFGLNVDSRTLKMLVFSEFNANSFEDLRLQDFPCVIEFVVGFVGVH